MHETDRRVLELMRGEAKASPKDEAIIKGMRLIGVRVADADEVEDGGAGSGNFGHSGRPGQIGGSGEGGGGGGKKASGSGEKSGSSKPSGNTSKFGEYVTTYRDGTKGYEKKDVDLTPEEHKQWMGAMDNWVKSEVENELTKNGYKRSDIDISIDREKGVATVKTWKKDPKSPSGLSNDYFDVKLKGDRSTSVKPDGKIRTWVSPKSVKLVYRGTEQY